MGNYHSVMTVNMICILTHYCSGGKIETNEMGRACGAFGGDRGCTGCWWGSLRERGHWGDQDVVGRIILRWIFWKYKGMVGTGLNWLRIGTGGMYFWVM